MKSVSVSLMDHFGLGTTTLAMLWKVVRQDNTIFGFTTHDQDITFYDGLNNVTYAAGSGMTNTANASKSDASPDNLEVTGFLQSDSITEADVRSGLWDNAVISIYVVNYKDLTMGDIKLRSGTTGEIKMANGIFTAEIRGLTQQLTTVIGQLYGPLCRAELFSNPGGGSGGGDVIDARSHYLCMLNAATYRQSGSVLASPDAIHITPNTGLLMHGSATPSNPAPAKWFDDGIIHFTSGVLANYTFEIKSWDGTTLTMYLPLPYMPTPSETFTIEPGCNKLGGATGDCHAKFNNIVNFRGEPFIPGNDLILLYPNAK